MELRQTQRQIQKLALTFQMRQSLHILQLPFLELHQYLEAAVEENPVFEHQTSKNDDTEITIPDKINLLEEISRDSFSQDFTHQESLQESRKKQDYQQSLITKSQTLQEVLQRQLRFNITDQKTYTLGELLIAHIDDNGYLNTSLESIVLSTKKKNAPSENNITLDDLECTLVIIQGFEPHGVGARNLKECLLIQLRLKKREKTLAYKIVEGFLPDVAKHNIKAIAKKLKIHPEGVQKTLNEIARLEPKPGRAFASIIEPSTRTQIPDIVVEKKGDQLEIIVNQRGLPRLQINNLYKNMTKSKEASAETKAYIKEKIKSAMGIIKAILQREQTLRTISECIVTIQKDFFLNGDSALLKPLTLKEVAHIANRDQSTISRVVNNKYIKTPYGIFKLNFFFLKPSKNKNNTDSFNSLRSTESIKSLIYDIISEEDTHHPLKDSVIVEELQKRGVAIARRTVVKYREEYEIPPAHRRKIAEKK